MFSKNIERWEEELLGRAKKGRKEAIKAYKTLADLYKVLEDEKEARKYERKAKVKSFIARIW